VSGTTVALLVLGVGGAVFLFMRSQTAQQQQLTAAQIAAGAGVPASGGGVQGTAQRLWEQWKSDPLGIQQHKETVKTIYNVGKTAVNGVVGVVGDVGSFIKGIF
jgi:hypothetical protein